MGKRALIIGAGIGGLCTAIALRKVGYAVRVLERTPEPKGVSAGMSLWSNAVWALHVLGLSESVLRLGSVVDVTRTQTAEGELLSDVHIGDISRRLGVPSVCIHRGDFHQILLDAVGPDCILTGVNCTGVAQDDTSVTAICENGALYRADIVIAADGIHSAVRRQLIGVEQPRYSGYTCYRSIVSMVHRSLPPGLAITAVGHGTEFGLFPCGMGRLYWFATHNQPAQLPDSPRGRKADCMSAFAGFSEPFVQALHLTSEASILRHDVYDRAPLAHWGEGRVTMLGDACHPMTPNLGQGACMAIEDAVVLARCLRDEPDEAKALRHYEAARRERTALMTTRSYYAGKILTLEDGVLSWFRDRLLHTKLGETKTESVLEKLLAYQVPTL